MSLSRTALPTLFALAPFAALAVQERVQKAGPDDFPSLLTQASEAWTAERYGACDESLKSALRLVGKKRREAILAAFPAATEGWTRKDAKADEAAMAMLAGLAGSVVEADYRGPEGRNLEVKAMVDSPMVQMMAMQLSNPAMLGDDAELIKYGQHRALLRKNSGNRYELMILVDDDIIQANSRSMSDDELLGVMSQSVVDGLAAAMAK
ncbi:MAG: hypothetical protein AAF726_21815 [Planctomycetota bacterium]